MLIYYIDILQIIISVKKILIKLNIAKIVY